jgi:Beta-lactamase
MARSKLPIFALLFSMVLGVSTRSQSRNAFLTADPEAEGVSSAGILAFLEAAGKTTNELHGFVFLRHGKLISEGWWSPYASNLKHTLYSTSKSFTATAVGFAVSEKRLTVNDKVISFFPNSLPDTISPFLAALTVKDLLSMSGGQVPDPTPFIVAGDWDWVKAFLAIPIVHPPGTSFLYNSMGTYMLSAIVQKVTGQKLIDYLRPRLFEPLGIEGMDWEVDPKGINTGGWGLRLKTEDMAKFGQLFLQHGKWNGKQILPPGWMEEASTAKIIQHPDLPQAKKDSSDWEQGYCYQMWRCRHNGFRADGAFGQFIIMLPDQDAVIAINAEVPDMQNEINLVWTYLLPAMHEGALAADKKDDAVLQEKLNSLSLARPAGPVSSPLVPDLSGKAFQLEPNEKQLRTMSFRFADGKCYLGLKTDSASYELAFGSSGWQKEETTLPGPNLVSNPRFRFTTFSKAEVAASYEWKDDSTLELTLRYIESPHTETFLCHFDQGRVSVTISNSFDYGKKKMVLTGSPAK